MYRIDFLPVWRADLGAQIWNRAAYLRRDAKICKLRFAFRIQKNISALDVSMTNRDAVDVVDPHH